MPRKESEDSPSEIGTLPQDTGDILRLILSAGLDCENKDSTPNASPIKAELSAEEYSLLLALNQHPNQFVTTSRLLQITGGYETSFPQVSKSLRERIAFLGLDPTQLMQEHVQVLVGLPEQPWHFTQGKLFLTVKTDSRSVSFSVDFSENPWQLETLTGLSALMESHPNPTTQQVRDALHFSRNTLKKRLEAIRKRLLQTVRWLDWLEPEVRIQLEAAVAPYFRPEKTQGWLIGNLFPELLFEESLKGKGSVASLGKFTVKLGPIETRLLVAARKNMLPISVSETTFVPLSVFMQASRAKSEVAKTLLAKLRDKLTTSLGLGIYELLKPSNAFSLSSPAMDEIVFKRTKTSCTLTYQGKTIRIEGKKIGRLVEFLVQKHKQGYKYVTLEQIRTEFPNLKFSYGNMRYIRVRCLGKLGIEPSSILQAVSGYEVDRAAMSSLSIKKRYWHTAGWLSKKGTPNP